MNCKHHKVLIPHTVKIALQEQVDYIAIKQGESLNARRWLAGIVKAISSLSKFPQRCSVAPENAEFGNDANFVIRHLIYKKSFRIVFTVVGNEVRVLSVRHSARET